MTEEEKPEPAADQEKKPDQMTEAELRAELEKHFREQKVDEMLVQFMVTLTNLAYIKMGLTEDTQDVKDLEQASLAIDAFKALLESVEKRLPVQDAQALAGALSSMQMTFVKAGSPASGGGGSGDKDSPESGSGGSDSSGEDEGNDSEEQKPEDDGPASRLWVPGKD